MQKLRKHILKAGVIALVCFGLIMAVGKPVEATQPEQGFAHWLQKLAKINQSSKLIHKLDSLTHSNLGMNELFKQAVKIINESGDNLKLPDNTSPKEFHQILLMKWNQYRTGHSMSAVQPGRTKQLTESRTTVKYFQGGLEIISGFKNKLAPSFLNQPLPFLPPGIDKKMIPLVNQISIGAP